MEANNKAMREALVEARKVIKAMGGYWARETLPIIDAALAAPPRACDVMSPEDLTKVVISGFLKSLGLGQENQRVIELAKAAISAAIKCAYDTQLVVKKGAPDGSK